MTSKRWYRLTLVAQLLSALLFFVGSLRFISHDDTVGAVIFGVTTLVVLISAFGTYTQLRQAH